MTRTGKFWVGATRAPFASALAILAITAGLRAFITPESLPLHAVIGSLSLVWGIVYGTGGLFIIYGMGTFRPKFEAAGCVLFGGGALVQALVTLAFIGGSPFLTGWSVFSLLIFATAGFMRSRHLTRGEQLVWVKGGLE